MDDNERSESVAGPTNDDGDSDDAIEDSKLGCHEKDDGDSQKNNDNESSANNGSADDSSAEDKTKKAPADAEDDSKVCETVPSWFFRDNQVVSKKVRMTFSNIFHSEII